MSVALAQDDAGQGDAQGLRTLWTAPVNASPGFSNRDESPLAAFAPGSVPVAICNEKFVDIRNPRSGARIRRVGPHPYTTLSVVWSPDSKLLAVTMLSETFGYGGQPPEIKPEWRDQSEVYLWRVADGEQHARCRGHHMQVVGSQFSPDSRRLLTFGIDDAMRLWDTGGGEQTVLETFVRGGSIMAGPARWGAFSGHPVRLITSQWSSVLNRDPITGRADWQQRTSGQQSPFAVFGSNVIVCSQDLLEFAARAHEPAKRFEAQKTGAAQEHRPLRQSAVASSGAFLMLAQIRADGLFSQLPGSTMSGWKVLDDDYDYSYGMPVFSPDGSWLFAQRWNGKDRFELTLWDTSEWKLRHVHFSEKRRTGPFIGPAGGRAIFTSDSRYLSFAPDLYWETSTGDWKAPPQQIPAERWGFSGDGCFMLTLVNNGRDGTVSMYDFESIEPKLTATTKRP
ncbi:MAG TPA: WD40 repeat domain-containing protein [Pirellulales bacterium]|jgi:WD40 repeat protein